MTKNCLNCYYRMSLSEDGTEIICELDIKHIKEITYCDDWKSIPKNED